MTQKTNICGEKNRYYLEIETKSELNNYDFGYDESNCKPLKKKTKTKKETDVIYPRKKTAKTKWKMRARVKAKTKKRIKPSKKYKSPPSKKKRKKKRKEL